MSRHSLQHPQHQNSGATLTAVLVTANREYRRRLANLLANRLGFTRVIEVEGLADACQQASADLIVIDLSVPDAGDGVCWGGLKFCSPNAQLAAIFDGQFSQSTRLAFAAGVTGFLSLDVTDEILAMLFEDVMHGIHVVPSTDFFEQLQAIEAEAKEEPAITSTRPPNPILEKLTPRERDIVRLIAEGASNKEIAAKLQLSKNTVRNRVGDIMNKLGLCNRTQVAIWARENGLGGEQ
jgi:DNA-binding NarL/FixJ family response regulator